MSNIKWSEIVKVRVVCYMTRMRNPNSDVNKRDPYFSFTLSIYSIYMVSAMAIRHYVYFTFVLSITTLALLLREQ
jgi:hypothetical protein